MKLQRRYLTSPIGRIQVVCETDAVVAILWDTDASISEGAAHNLATKAFGGAPIVDVEIGINRILDSAVEQLAEYFAGIRTDFDLPLAPTGTEFQQKAWAALRTIPFGRTVSYGQQAAAMGDKKQARAVGGANSKNPIPIVVPCHRVIGSSGALTGFAGGLGVKAWLLAHEQTTLSRP